MAINYIPNDPKAGTPAPAMGKKTPSATRPASRSGFNYSKTSPEAVAAPGTPQFLFWQAREASILTLEAYERATGTPHTRWQGNRTRIDLKQDAGKDLNAFYDRSSFSFFHETVGTTTFYSGASADVVSHEVGHGLLDALRPDLWSVTFLEVGAFHEAFGDCMAILTALDDAKTRTALLQGGTKLRRANFVEATAEELSYAIGLAFPGHNAAAPRRAFNAFQYQLPSTLPSDGGPGKLINEVHSFGMIFTGIFWELICILFDAAPTKDSAALAKAARLAAKLTVEGASRAVIAPRFLQNVGRAMVLGDQALYGGANGMAIRDAFSRHGILLGTNALLAPALALDGMAPKGGSLALTARRDLARRLGAVSAAKIAVSAFDSGADAPTVSAVHTRAVSLAGLHPALEGVVALAPEPVTVGASGKRAAVLGRLPNNVETETEVHEFVQSLLDHRRILLPGDGPDSASRREYPKHATHAVRSLSGKQVLVRVRFACGQCNAGHTTHR